MTVSTDKQIQLLKPKSSSYFERIKNSGGLCIRVYPNKTKKWYYRYEEKLPNKKRKSKSIALHKDYPDFTLADANEKSQIMTKLRKSNFNLSSILADGFILEEIELSNIKGITPDILIAYGFKAKIMDTQSLKELLNQWYSIYIVHNRKRPHVVKQTLDSNIIPVIGNLLPSELTTTYLINNLFNPLLERNIIVQAQKVFEHLKQGLGWIERTELVGNNWSSPLKNLNKKDLGLIKPISEIKPEVSLTMPEIKIFLNFLDHGKHKMSKIVIFVLKILLLTGQRTIDIRNAPWSEFDFNNNIWIIPWQRYKTGHLTYKDHKIPLSPQVTSILIEIKELINEEKDGYPSEKLVTTLSDKALSKAVARIQDRLDGVQKFTPHELRKTFTTRLPSLGIDAFLIEKIIGHTMPPIFLKYQHEEFLDKRRDALCLWADTILPINKL